MPFTNNIVAGTTLVIPAIRSANYVAGMSGWSINADGTSEFSNVTVRGPVIITDNMGAVLASIGATGNGSFQNIAITGDMTFGSTTLLTELALRAKGVVAWYSSTTTLPNSGSNAFVDIISLSWISEGTTRLYKIEVGPIGAFNAGSSTFEWQNKLLVDGSQVFLNQQEASGGGTQAVNCSFTGVFALGTHTVTWAANGSNGHVYAFGSVSGSVPNLMTVTDVGEAISTSGNIGPPGAVTKTATYICTGSRSYDHSGNYIGAPDGDDNIYYGGGNSNRSFGNECDILLFNGSQMRTDLTGATILSAQLWLYCFTSINPEGSYGFNVGLNTSLPTTASWAGNSPAYFLDQTWPVPGWASIDLTTGALNSFINSGGNSILGSKIFSSENTGFRGYGYSTSFQPYIMVVYST